MGTDARKRALLIMENRIPLSFFTRDALEVAPSLLGKILCRRTGDGTIDRYTISETEAYRGEEDRACHASRGMTPRTSVMYEPGGILYMYLIYGMYWMMNIVTARAGDPQAVLIRGLREVNGPGRLTRALRIERSFNREALVDSPRIWLEENQVPADYTTHPRIGIDYAGEYWRDVEWRFVLHENSLSSQG